MVSHQEVIYNYFNAGDRQHYNKGNNVFFEGDTLYSYGTYFILAQKIKNGYLINGDSYSKSTSEHQRIVRYNMPSNNIIIPLSALLQPLNDMQIKDIEILDRKEDTYDTVERVNSEGNKYMATIHHLGASLFKYKSKYFLSGIDNSSKNYAYYLILLKKPAQTVEEAFRQLAGNLTDEEYKDYLQGIIKRQGEYFLIPSKLTTAQLKRMDAITPRKIKHDVDLSKGVGNAHIAKDLIKMSDGLYIRRSLRHREHRMISLKNTWHKVVKNIQKNSWSADGRID
jgi:hypothetical protein